MEQQLLALADKTRAALDETLAFLATCREAGKGILGRGVLQWGVCPSVLCLSPPSSCTEAEVGNSIPGVGAAWEGAAFGSGL